jgi:hypothetical protein
MFVPSLSWTTIVFNAKSRRTKETVSLPGRWARESNASPRRPPARTDQTTGENLTAKCARARAHTHTHTHTHTQSFHVILSLVLARYSFFSLRDVCPRTHQPLSRSCLPVPTHSTVSCHPSSACLGKTSILSKKTQQRLLLKISSAICHVALVRTDWLAVLGTVIASLRVAHAVLC